MTAASSEIDEYSSTSELFPKPEGTAEVIRARSRLLGFLILIFILIAIFIYCGRGCITKEERILSVEELNNKVFPEFLQSSDSTAEEDVLLPGNVWADAYELEIIPFIWEGTPC